MTDAALTLADGRRVPYQIVISPRSRAVRLRLSAKNGLVITVPRGFDQSQLATILDAKRDWVARHLARIEAIHSPTLVSTAPPVELKLLAVAESWQIAYRATSANYRYGAGGTNRGVSCRITSLVGASGTRHVGAVVGAVV